LPMVKTSTLLYICDNLDEEGEELIDVDALTRKEESDFTDVWQLLDALVVEPDQELVRRVINQTCQL
jgi:hypothetical protein